MTETVLTSGATGDTDRATVKESLAPSFIIHKRRGKTL
jgi:hypothetical protein